MGSDLDPGDEARTDDLRRSERRSRLGEPALGRRAVPNAEFGLLPDDGLRGQFTEPHRRGRHGADVRSRGPARSRSPGAAATWCFCRRTFATRIVAAATRCAGSCSTTATLYKPGERVHVKGWLRIATGGKNGDIARLPAGGHRVDFKVTDARGSKIAEGKTDVDSDGGFTLAFDVPKNANLGHGGVHFELRRAGRRLLERPTTPTAFRSRNSAVPSSR